MPKKFYITTAIDYVNASPHIGHALEKVQADVLARYHRQKKDDVFFLTGTDENSLKNVQAAKKEKIETQKLVNRNSKVFENLKSALNLSFDDFIRTTEKRHIKGVEKFWKLCQKDVYKKKYKGLYCVGCEMFYKESELKNGLCPEHNKKPDVVEEENYFFKLTNYQKQLEKIIESDEIKIIPETRKNEVLSFIKSGLEDFSISRSSKRAEGWGIPVPDDKTQIIYVWFDALLSYINALGYGSSDLKKYKKYWPADIHCIGKGILRFHAVYWPAMLLSAGLPLPEKIFIHGYLTINRQKISKSLGNVIDPFDLTKKHGIDAVRYYLLREFNPTEDGDFSIARFKERYNADLANGLGNLVSRVLTLSSKNNISVNLIKNKKEHQSYHTAIKNFKFHEALEFIWQLIDSNDKYIEKTKPWELLKKQNKKDKLNKILSELLANLKEITYLLEPFLPETSEKILAQIKQNKKTTSLFPRLQ